MLSGYPTIFGIDPYSVSTTPLHQLGVKGVTPDGRVFRYAYATTEIAAAKLTVAADLSTNHEDVVFQTAAAVGDQQVSLTIATTALVANEYDGGYLIIIDDAGEGYTHLIERHDAGTGTITFDIKPGIQVATTTSTTACLVRNPYREVVISATDQADIPLGVTPRVASATSYFWLQTGGYTGCLADESVAAGDTLTIGTGTAGAVEAADAANEPIIGFSPAGVNMEDGEHNPIFLTLDS